MENLKNKEVRVPRPKNLTTLSRSGLRKEARSLLIRKYLSGEFPYPGVVISANQLAELYGIPLGEIERAMMEGLHENLFVEEGNSAKTLQKAISTSLSSVLSRIGFSDLLGQRALEHLGTLLLQNPDPHPLMVKEFNNALGNHIRLSDTQVKVISQLHSLLTSAPIDSPEEDQLLTKTEILSILEQKDLEPQELQEHLEGIPDVHPLPEAKAKTSTLLQEATHDFLEGEEIKPTKPISSPTPLPR